MLLLVISLILIIVVMSLMNYTETSWEKIKTDWRSPADLVIFREPNVTYHKEYVDEWVQDNDRSNIPLKVIKAEDRKRTIIYSHGNAENLFTSEQFRTELSTSLNVNFVEWDYPGYGRHQLSESGRDSSVLSDLLMEIVESQVSSGVEYGDIYLMGRSLGSGPTCAVASRLSGDKSVGGVILISPFSSLRDIVSDYSNDAVASAITERWDNYESLKIIDSPILIIHGEDDGIIGLQHTAKLAGANTNTQVETIRGKGHNDIPVHTLVKIIQTFIINDSV